jgi:hypothetical protein
VRLGVQRHGPGASALGGAYDDLERCLVAAAGCDRGAPARVGLAAAFLDVAEREAGEFGPAESRAREELEDRAVASPDRGAAVRACEQLGELQV